MIKISQIVIKTSQQPNLAYFDTLLVEKYTYLLFLACYLSSAERYEKHVIR